MGLFDRNKVKEFIRWAEKNNVKLPTTEHSKLKEITKLNIRFSGIKELPVDIEGLENLVEIDLSYNNLTALPVEISKLKNLELVNLERNSFTEIPKSVLKLEKLRFLDVENNKLTEVPSEIGQLQNLEVLNLFSNSISKVSPEIGKLKHLKELNLAGNKIASLPSEIGNLEKLEILNLQSNNLDKLPIEISKLKELTELNVWSNNISEVQDEIKNLPKLLNFQLLIDKSKLNQNLLDAIQADNCKVAKFLISRGADVNYKHIISETDFTNPLFEAKSLACIRLLLSHNADPNVKREKHANSSIKVWESDEKHSGQFETFLNKRHSPDVEKYLKSIGLL